MPSATPSGRTAAARTAAVAQAAASIPSVEKFERIVDDYQRRLYGFALRMTGNREDAEEIVQDAFVRAYRALGKMSLERAARRSAPAALALYDYAERHPQPAPQQAPRQRGPRCARRPRRSVTRIERGAASARENCRAKHRDRAGRACAAPTADAFACGGDSTLHRRAQPPRDRRNS